MSAPVVTPEQEVNPPTPPVLPDDVVTEFTPSAPQVEEGAPAWMMTFGDMMSLLLTFFILLFSMSEIKVEKFRAAAISLSEGLGAEPRIVPTAPANAGEQEDSTAVVPVPPVPVPPASPDETDTELDAIAEQLENFVRENQLEETVIVARENHGVYLRIQDIALFGPGEVGIKADNEWLVDRLAEVTRIISARVVVSGHTDNVPINSAQFRSNWELSAVRAAGVTRGLVALGQDPQLITVEAFGDQRPIDTNATREGRAKNRRVELFYSRQNVEEALAGDAN